MMGDIRTASKTVKQIEEEQKHDTADVRRKILHLVVGWHRRRLDTELSQSFVLASNDRNGQCRSVEWGRSIEDGKLHTYTDTPGYVSKLGE